MIEPDTSKAEVDGWAAYMDDLDYRHAATLLRALLAERDAARAMLEARAWPAMAAATCTGALTLEQRVAALEERMRNR